MEHADAVREMSVEKYLLGELVGTERDTFEEHLFDCEMCTADLRGGVTFAQAAREQLAAPAPVRAPQKQEASSWFGWLLRPQWMAPALAACLLVIGYQNGVLLPALRNQAAESKAPQVVSTIAVSSGALRGDALPRAVVPKNGEVVLQVDLPLRSVSYASYQLSLYSPTGALVWKRTMPAAQVGDSVSISLSPGATQAGKNTLLVQGVRAESSAGATLDDLAKHEFLLDIQP